MALGLEIKNYVPCWVALELWWRYNYSEYGTLFMQFVIQNYNTTKFPLLGCTHPADGTLDRYSFHFTGISILQVNVELISRIINCNSSSSFMVSSIDGLKAVVGSRKLKPVADW